MFNIILINRTEEFVTEYNYRWSCGLKIKVSLKSYWHLKKVHLCTRQKVLNLAKSGLRKRNIFYAPKFSIVAHRSSMGGWPRLGIFIRDVSKDIVKIVQLSYLHIIYWKKQSFLIFWLKYYFKRIIIQHHRFGSLAVAYATIHYNVITFRLSYVYWFLCKQNNMIYLYINSIPSLNNYINFLCILNFKIFAIWFEFKLVVAYACYIIIGMACTLYTRIFALLFTCYFYMIEKYVETFQPFL